MAGLTAHFLGKQWVYDARLLPQIVIRSVPFLMQYFTSKSIKMSGKSSSLLGKQFWTFVESITDFGFL